MNTKCRRTHPRRTLPRLSARWLALGLLCAAGLAARADFDRLRINVSSSSDWTILRLTGPERLVGFAGTALAGQPTFQTAADSLQVSQSLSNAQAGVTVVVQFDVILQSSNPPAIGFESTRGNLGRARMDFYQYNSTNAPVVVASVTNAVTTGHPNARSFSLPTGSLLAGDFGASRPPLTPRVLAFYYPWYSYDSWASPTLKDYPRAPYHSDSNSVILRHVREAKAAGIDGFISSWWGPGTQTDRNLARLLAIAEAQDFLVSIYFETLTGDPAHARDEAELLSWLRYFLQTYRSHPRLLRVEGRPVVFIWAAGAAPTDVWDRVFTTLRGEGLEACYSANTLSTAYLAVFDGLHDYASAFRGTLEADFQQAATACRLYGWVEGQPRLRIWAATSAAVQFTVLPVLPVTFIPAGTVWGYLDTGVDPGPSWTSPDFDDRAWRTGPAQLGYGDGDEATVVSFGPDSNNKHMTTWFRRRFFVADARAVQGLMAGLVRDDGAVVYLNGAEVWRDNMPAGPVTATTPANNAIGGSAESAWLTKPLNPTTLVSGTNILTVEIHQNTNSSSDLSFDFSLAATTAVPPPALTIGLSGGSASLSRPATEPGLFRVSTATHLAPPIVWTPLTNAPLLLGGAWRLALPPPTNASRFYRLETE